MYWVYMLDAVIIIVANQDCFFKIFHCNQIGDMLMALLNVATELGIYLTEGNSVIRRGDHVRHLA
jgi:hypothetical protein